MAENIEKADDYKKLVDYLEIRYDPTYKYVPIDFFEALNKKNVRYFQKPPVSHLEHFLEDTLFDTLCRQDHISH